LPGFHWGDCEWMAARSERQSPTAPISVYEVHPASWRRAADGGLLSYRELAQKLVQYVLEMGFTHVELMPVTEHPFDGSWGYQTLGFFAPTSRHGSPHDFMAFVDRLHRAGIGVILDWVPAHFPHDEHGLSLFDGTHLYEHADPRRGTHPDWGTLIFDYGRCEVVQFLLNSALFWLEKYHIDGLRVDAVSSMLYLDYSRKEDEWLPNEQGGRENLEAVAFARRLNQLMHERHAGVLIIAEESTTWPKVTGPLSEGGLGFDLKWNLGWMHDTLEFFGREPAHRRHHYDKLTFALLHAFNESFMLPFSHDEVVHGKGSLLARMPGNRRQQFANLRLLFAYMYTHPGKKLLFMGNEFGQVREWDHDNALDWERAVADPHRQLKRLLGDLNRLYRAQPALHELDSESGGFEWICFQDAESGVL
ncbi:MAG: 1,4-alpha-glucan branching protein GlgB, partial [Anaerolineales bacterium]|nr:1,4-alpha-glucan branching protein GlgB [Anaerolineales bacterium]